MQTMWMKCVLRIYSVHTVKSRGAYLHVFVLCSGFLNDW